MTDPFEEFFSSQDNPLAGATQPVGCDTIHPLVEDVTHAWAEDGSYSHNHASVLQHQCAECASTQMLTVLPSLVRYDPDVRADRQGETTVVSMPLDALQHFVSRAVLIAFMAYNRASSMNFDLDDVLYDVD